MEFIQTLQRRDRGFVIGLTLIFSGLVMVTLFVLRNQMIDGGTPKGIDFWREWSVVLLLALPWGAALWIVLRYRRMLARQGDYSGSIADSVRGLLEQNRFAQVRTRLILVLEVIVLPVLALVILQLEGVGKMRPHEAKSAAVFFGAAMLVAIGSMLWQLYRKLRPEEKRLATLLSSYESDAVGRI